MRRFARHPTDIPILVQAAVVQPNGHGASQMTTVSQGGLSCEVDCEFAIGSQVNVHIPSVTPPYQGVGVVVWCLPSGDHFEIGLRFTDREEAYKSRMVQQVCQIEHYKNLVFEQEGRVIDGNQAASEWIQKHAATFD